MRNAMIVLCVVLFLVVIFLFSRCEPRLVQRVAQPAAPVVEQEYAEFRVINLIEMLSELDFDGNRLQAELANNPLYMFKGESLQVQYTDGIRPVYTFSYPSYGKAARIEFEDEGDMIEIDGFEYEGVFRDSFEKEWDIEDNRDLNHIGHYVFGITGAYNLRPIYFLKRTERASKKAVEKAKKAKATKAEVQKNAKAEVKRYARDIKRLTARAEAAAKRKDSAIASSLAKQVKKMVTKVNALEKKHELSKTNLSFYSRAADNVLTKVKNAEPANVKPANQKTVNSYKSAYKKSDNSYKQVNKKSANSYKPANKKPANSYKPAKSRQ
ncbi:hypothetical protein ACFL08_02195 [Patescibacteria group bacterium]